MGTPYGAVAHPRRGVEDETGEEGVKRVQAVTRKLRDDQEQDTSSCRHAHSGSGVHGAPGANTAGAAPRTRGLRHTAAVTAQHAPTRRR
ncbi:hypothetical protein GCM10018773_10740 [Streptomyces candidus]|nr:hypothetical protein GCM10018773_10740 [Streptomyces candidus]